MRTPIAVAAAVATAAVLISAAPGALAAQLTPRHHGAVSPATEPTLSLQVGTTGIPAAAVIGKGNSLWYLTGKGPTWRRTELAGTGSAFGGPSLYLTPAPAAEIAVQGHGHSLVFYYQSHGAWHHLQIAGAGHAYSAPSLVIGLGGPGIAVEGPHNTLWYYWSKKGHWSGSQVNGNGTDHSAPSLVIRAPNQAQGKNGAGQPVIAVQGAGNTLDIYRRLTSGQWKVTHVLGPNRAFSAPSLVIETGPGTPGSVDVAVQGAGHSVTFVAGTLSSRPGLPTTLEGGRVFSAPSLTQNYEDPGGQVEMVFQYLHSSNLDFLFLNTSGSVGLWQNDVVSAALGLVDSAPSMALNSTGNSYAVIAQGPANSLYFYAAARPAVSSGPTFTGHRVAGSGTTFGG